MLVTNTNLFEGFIEVPLRKMGESPTMRMRSDVYNQIDTGAVEKVKERFQVPV